MRRTLLPWMALALTTACGNFSNDDLLFLNALPVREDLEPRVPQTGTSSGGLTSTSRWGLAVGEPSALYADTKAGARAFNAGLGGILDAIEAVRGLSPTRREPGLRVWGPYDDRRHPGYQVRMQILRHSDELFTYSVDWRRRLPSPSEWVSGIEGQFHAAAGIRVGTGELHLYAARVRAAGMPTPGLEELDHLDVTYSTASTPITVDISFVAVPFASYSRLDYQFRQAETGAGSIAFTLERDLILGFGGQEQLDITSRWLADGRGRADAVVSGGDVTGEATNTECWDTDYLLTYAMKSWDGTLVGDPAACPDVSGL